MATGLNRRTVLKLLAIAGLQFGAVRGLYCAGAAAAGEPCSGVRSFDPASLFSDQSAAIALGRRYIATHPEMSQGAILRMQELWRVHGSDEKFAQALVQRRVEEFARSESLLIDGWLLARCEADLCAAIALQADGVA